MTNGVTQFGQSTLFTITANGATNVPPIVLGLTTLIPNSLSVTAPATSLTQAGGTVQLAVTATYVGGSTQDVSAASAGTVYNVSNAAIATVSASGLVTAVSSGTALIQAVNEGTQGVIGIQVVLAGASNGGIPVSWALANGLDPADPALPFEDPDHDGLTNLQEFQQGTNPNNPDTDGDGLTDGQEVLIYQTNPLLFSTDGTGISDGIEAETGTLGLSLSQKLAKAISMLSVTPSNFVLDVNSTQGIASQQLSVKATLIDGKTVLDLTSTATATNYASSDLTICNFGSPDGNVFAGNNGTCTITVTNNGFTVKATGTVMSFSPMPLSFVVIPGFANAVAVNGNYAYVAAGASGLQVVNTTDRTQPRIAAALNLPGNANDVKLLGNTAYIAAGTAGLHVVDITNPLAPVLRGTHAAGGGNALDLTVLGTTAYIANGSNLLLLDITNPPSMVPLSSLPLKGTFQGVDVDPVRKLALVAAGTAGIYVVDTSNPVAPVLLGNVSTGDARDVVIGGNFAFVADYVNSTTSVDITTPSSPVVRSHITDPNLGGFLQDIVLSGNLVYGADVKFVNGIPITDITDPTNLIARAILNFPQRDDNGMGIAADASYVYLATEHNNVNKFESTGDSRLYIGQYRALQDSRGIPPTVSLASPVSGTPAIQGATLPITVNATDDVAVAAVNFLVNGQVVFTATATPYQFNYVIPNGAYSLTIGATAIDFGGNVGTAQNLVLQVMPDPLTTVTGKVLQGPPGTIITPTNINGWSQYQQNGGTALITGTNPRSGNGSLEFVAQNPGANSALILRSPSPEGFGLASNLNALSYDWFIASDSSTVFSPEIAVRVYSYGNPRSFFLHFTPCTSNCPVGSWQHSNALPNLMIQQAENNPPPSTIPSDAYISEIHLRGFTAFQGPFHGFDDNVTIEFSGQPPVTYNFEASIAGIGPAPGATVAVFTSSTTAAADGSFSISGIPTVLGSIQANARVTVNSVPLAGVSAPTPPVPAGDTNVGNIITTTPIYVANVAIGPANPIFLSPNGTIGLSATALDNTGTPVPATFSWSSSDPNVAVVDGSGFVTAKRVGVTTISAKDTGSGITGSALFRISGDFFFWSIYPSELANFSPSYWKAEGPAFGVYQNVVSVPGLIPLYRFYDPDSATHFWTTDVNGELFTQNPDVVHEGVAAYVFNSQQPGTVPVYRWFNTVTGAHFWSTDSSGENLLNPNFQLEGVVFYAYPAGQGPVPMLRVQCISCQL